MYFFYTSELPTLATTETENQLPRDTQLSYEAHNFFYLAYKESGSGKQSPNAMRYQLSHDDESSTKHTTPSSPPPSLVTVINHRHHAATQRCLV